MTTTFTGFPPAAFAFLSDLAANNEKTWFETNRTRYENDLLAPALDFVTAVGQQLQTLVPSIQYDTRVNGSGSLMRIHRDTRFSKDKTPYKTHIAGMWWLGDGKKTASPAFGFQLTAQGMGLMAGMFGFSKAQLAAYREAVVADDTGQRLQALVDTVAAFSAYEMMGQHYKRVPRGFDADHPRADLLRHNALYVHIRQPLTPTQVASPALIDRCQQHFTVMAAVPRWLAQIFAM